MKRLIYLPLLLLVTVANAQYKTEIYVAQDGSGDFTSIQAAIDDTKSFPDTRITIFIKDGIYEEKVKVHAWNTHLTLRGESPTGTIIRWGDYFDKIDRGRNSTFHTATLLVQGDDFRAENLTISNTAGEVGQAVALAIEADRSAIINCRMFGHQDTLYVDGANARQHFKNCYIEGTTDFIFGSATALFEDCTIHSKADSYITAASTPAGRPYGLVFLRCKLTAAEGVTSVYLGRPWRSYAQTVFLYCQMGDHIHPKGWHNWGSAEKEETVFYGEYGNTGPGTVTTQRASWAHQLKRRQAKKHQPERVLQPFLLPDISN
jgi:pectinesterase